MNLKVSFPAGIDPASVAFSLPFDIDEHARTVNGHLTATREKLTVYLDGVPQKEIGYPDITGMEVRELTGSSMPVSYTHLMRLASKEPCPPTPAIIIFVVT